MVKTLSVVAGVAIAAAAQAQNFNFELPNYNGSAAGVTIVGQNGWTASPVAGSLNHNVHTYAGNSLGLVQNPVGGNQFMGGVSGAAAARAQVGVPFNASTYVISYDTAFAFGGTPPATANLASFSLNHNTLGAGTFQGFINLFNFTTPATPASGLKSEFNVFDAAGVAINNASPGAFWTNLQYNHWYRSFVTVDFSTHQVTNVAIIDLHTGQGASAAQTGWYLNGGAASTMPLPDAIRAFAGGNAGNTSGWDNIDINLVPAPATLGLLGLGGLFAARRRRA
ncbi:MAG: PEP-CTERM sorting domain-containing protein [Phycisphaerales bacterium]|nr:PEP-CTERM sorting domain-containing protein [Phycisphaerales bacterium]